MTASSTLSTIGTVGASVAAAIYLVPLPFLLREISRKKDDGGGILAGLVLLVPLWLLLFVATACVVARGGLDVVPWPRPVLHALAALALACMGVLSFLRFEFPRHPNRLVRLVGALPLHVSVVLSTLHAFVGLELPFVAALPNEGVRTAWIVWAAFALAFGSWFLLRRFARFGHGRVLGLVRRVAARGASASEILASIPGLDPDRDFEALLKRTRPIEHRTVRDAARVRLRQHPDLVGRLVAELGSREPEYALAGVAYVPWTSDERDRLARPACDGIGRMTRAIRHEWRYVPRERRAPMHRSLRQLATDVASACAGSGVDFAPAIAALEETFTTPEERWR